MNKSYIGRDNGVTGTIGFTGLQDHKIYTHGYDCFFTPVKKEQNYTKTKRNVSRILIDELIKLFRDRIGDNKEIFALIERPMINSLRFQSSITAARALEAQLYVLETLCIPYAYIDSKEWQKVMLPAGVEGSDKLKAASKDIGCRLFPVYKELFIKHKDADGMLIAEYGKRKGF